MKTKVQKWGNSLGLRIPKSFAEEAEIDDGQPVNIRLENGEIIIKSAKPSFKLNNLLRQINPRNIHDEINTGDNVGKEI